MNSVKKVDDPIHRMVTAKGAERIDNHRFPLAPFVWFPRAPIMAQTAAGIHSIR